MNRHATRLTLAGALTLGLSAAAQAGMDQTKDQNMPMPAPSHGMTDKGSDMTTKADMVTHDGMTADKSMKKSGGMMHDMAKPGHMKPGKMKSDTMKSNTMKSGGLTHDDDMPNKPI